MFHQGSHCVYSTLYWVSATTAINAAFKARPMMLGMGLLETAKKPNQSTTIIQKVGIMGIYGDITEHMTIIVCGILSG